MDPKVKEIAKDLDELEHNIKILTESVSKLTSDVEELLLRLRTND